MNEQKDEKLVSKPVPSVIPSGESPQTGSAIQTTTASSRSINFLLDIPLELTVEVGRRFMTMGELVNVLPGTIIELERPAGEQIDILANGKLVAKGEAVLVGERYGVRVLEIVGEEYILGSSTKGEGGAL